MPYPPTTAHRAGRRPRLAAACVALLAVVAAAACDGSTHSDAPVLTVVTGFWPLAQAAAEIGQGNVTVDDVVPAGTDPATYTLTSRDRAEVRGAGVDLEVDGLQPSFGAAPKGSARTVAIEGTTGSPYVWLSPYAMEKAVTAIAETMEAADPKADPTFKTGYANVESQLSSLDDDFQSTLSSCPEQRLVTIDDAFGVLHPRYPVTVEPVTTGPLTALPSKATVSHEVAAIRATGAREIYNETWVPESDILAATTETGVKVGTLDTLEGPPTTADWPYRAGQKYVSLMESDLSTISSALHCPNPDDN